MIQCPCGSVVGISSVKTKLVECPVVDRVPVEQSTLYVADLIILHRMVERC